MMPGYLVAQVLDESDQPVFRQEARIVLDQFGLGRAMDFSVEVPAAGSDAAPVLRTGDPCPLDSWTRCRPDVDHPVSRSCPDRSSLAA
jgi:hypothetical protein